MFPAVRMGVDRGFRVLEGIYGGYWRLYRDNGKKENGSYYI